MCRKLFEHIYLLFSVCEKFSMKSRLAETFQYPKGIKLKSVKKYRKECFAQSI